MRVRNGRKKGIFFSDSIMKKDSTTNSTEIKEGSLPGAIYFNFDNILTCLINHLLDKFHNFHDTKANLLRFLFIA